MPASDRNRITRVSAPMDSGAHLPPLGNLRQHAMQLHSQGRSAEAAPLYLKIIERHPDDYQMLVMLGVLRAQEGQLDDAIAWLGRAIGVNAHSPQAHNNLGIVLHRQRSYEQALTSFDRALAIDPGYADAWSNRSIALQQLQRLDEALASSEQALGLQPQSAAAQGNRAGILRCLRRYEEALLGYERALVQQPTAVALLVNRARVLCELNRPREALPGVTHALALLPEFPDALIAQGICLRMLGQPLPALDCVERALRLRPDDADALCQQAATLGLLCRPAQALAVCERLIGLQPGLAHAHSHRGMALEDLGRREEALDSYDQALRIDPSDPTTHYNRARCLDQLRRFGDALGAYDRAICLDPSEAETRFGKSVCLLRVADFDHGWPLYEARKQRRLAHAGRQAPTRLPEWSGQPISERTLLVYWEQGLGDSLQFCRYARAAERLGAHVALDVQPCLRRLLRSLSPTIQMVEDGQAPSPADYQCAMMSLAGVFHALGHAVPAEVPYLAAEPERAARWQRWLGIHGFRIGVCWQGSEGRVDLGRSYPVSALQALASLPGVRLISLQRGAGSEQVTTLPASMPIEVPPADFDVGGEAFVDSAALMHSLDLIITSDTAIAHLAGALGRPTWLALRDVPDWRWFLDRDDSPWYPSLRLFRQRSCGHWVSVFDRMAIELRQWLNDRTMATAR